MSDQEEKKKGISSLANNPYVKAKRKLEQRLKDYSEGTQDNSYMRALAKFQNLSDNYVEESSYGQRLREWEEATETPGMLQLQTQQQIPEMPDSATLTRILERLKKDK